MQVGSTGTVDVFMPPGASRWQAQTDAAGGVIAYYKSANTTTLVPVFEINPAKGLYSSIIMLSPGPDTQVRFVGAAGSVVTVQFERQVG